MTCRRLSTAAIVIAGSVGCSSDAILGVLGDGGSGTTAGVDTSGGDSTSGSWSTISQNTLSDVDPCVEFPCSWSGLAGQDGVLGLWNGGAFAEDLGAQGSLIAWGGGGNSGYHGNEVYAFDVADGLWSRLTDPVEDPQPTDPAFGELQDGTPVAFQNNDLLEYHPPTRSLVALGGGTSLASDRNGSGHLFDFEALTWRRAAVTPLETGIGATAYDRAREVVWGHAQGGPVYEYQPVGGPDAQGRHGSVQIHGATIPVMIYTVGAIEARLDLFVLWDANGGQLLAIPLDDPGRGPTEVTTAGQAPTIGGGGFEWVPEREQFFWYAGSGNDIRTLTAPDRDWATEPWRWQPVEVLGGDPPVARNTPIFSSWRWAPAIESFVICNGAEEPVHAFKI